MFQEKRFDITCEIGFGPSVFCKGLSSPSKRYSNNGFFSNSHLLYQCPTKIYLLTLTLLCVKSVEYCEVLATATSQA